MNRTIRRERSHLAGGGWAGKEKHLLKHQIYTWRDNIGPKGTNSATHTGKFLEHRDLDLAVAILDDVLKWLQKRRAVEILQFDAVALASAHLPALSLEGSQAAR